MTFWQISIKFSSFGDITSIITIKVQEDWYFYILQEEVKIVINLLEGS